jgi:hypothetical protein
MTSPQKAAATNPWNQEEREITTENTEKKIRTLKSIGRGTRQEGGINPPLQRRGTTGLARSETWRERRLYP